MATLVVSFMTIKFTGGKKDGRLGLGSLLGAALLELPLLFQLFKLYYLSLLTQLKKAKKDEFKKLLGVLQLVGDSPLSYLASQSALNGKHG